MRSRSHRPPIPVLLVLFLCAAAAAAVCSPAPTEHTEGGGGGCWVQGARTCFYKRAGGDVAHSLSAFLIWNICAAAAGGRASAAFAVLAAATPRRRCRRRRQQRGCQCHHHSARRPFGAAGGARRWLVAGIWRGAVRVAATSENPSASLPLSLPSHNPGRTARTPAFVFGPLSSLDDLPLFSETTLLDSIERSTATCKHPIAPQVQPL